MPRKRIVSCVDGAWRSEIARSTTRTWGPVSVPPSRELGLRRFVAIVFAAQQSRSAEEAAPNRSDFALANGEYRDCRPTTATLVLEGGSAAAWPAARAAGSQVALLAAAGQSERLRPVW